jgi:hypothetical protein
MGERKLHLYTGDLEFKGIALDRANRAIVLKWEAETELMNVLWVRLVVVCLGFPFLRWVSAFMFTD